MKNSTFFFLFFFWVGYLSASGHEQLVPAAASPSLRIILQRRAQAGRDRHVDRLAWRAAPAPGSARRRRRARPHEPPPSSPRRRRRRRPTCCSPAGESPARYRDALSGETPGRRRREEEEEEEAEGEGEGGDGRPPPGPAVPAAAQRAHHCDVEEQEEKS